jgi:hypothetical protein
MAPPKQTARSFANLSLPPRFMISLTCAYKRKPRRECRVVTVPMNSRETGGTGSAVFDFQLRPVGDRLSL